MKRIAIASLFTLGLLSAASIPVQAAPTAPMQSGVSGHSELLQNAASRSDRNNSRSNRHETRRSWDRRRDGQRCRSRSGNCRHYHNGYWYSTPWWTLPLIGGAMILNSQGNGGGGSRHEQWCEDHYRSYNPSNNTWVAYSGAVRQCVSPYGR